RTPRSRSIADSRGTMNVVSDRFISLAIDCISESLSPVPSENTASEFPSRGVDEKTSHCVIASRLVGWLIEFLQSEKSVAMTMNGAVFPMQKITNSRGTSSIQVFDTDDIGAYPNQHMFHPFAAVGMCCCCCLMPACG